VLPDLLRDLGDPFPAIWDQFHGAHGPREAARYFARVLGQLETHVAAVVVPALIAALATGTSLLLALTPTRRSSHRLAPEAVPAPLRAIEVGSGRAADYDAWLGEVAGCAPACFRISSSRRPAASSCPASRARLKGSPGKPGMPTGHTKTISTRS